MSEKMQGEFMLVQLDNSDKHSMFLSNPLEACRLYHFQVLRPNGFLQ